MKEKNFISIVVYIYNTGHYIEKFLQLINNKIEMKFENYEIIFVNDFSEDNSEKIIESLVKKYILKHSATIVNMSSYQGLELAMIAGNDLAIGDYIYEFDTPIIDYSDDIIFEVYKKCLDGYDIVVASPNRKIDYLANIFYKILNFSYSDISQKIYTTTFKIVTRRAINRVNTISKSVPYRKLQYTNCGLPSHYIFYRSTSNNKHTSTIKTVKKRFNTAVDSLIIFTNVFSKLSIILSLIFLLMALGFGIYAVTSFFSTNKPVEGWSPIMGFLSAGFSGVFIIFTMIIKYLTIILNLVFTKQKYLVKNINKIQT